MYLQNLGLVNCINKEMNQQSLVCTNENLLLPDSESRQPMLSLSFTLAKRKRKKKNVPLYLHVFFLFHSYLAEHRVGVFQRY